MMTAADWRALVVVSITDPATAARQILSLSLGRDVLWLALLLAVVLNTLVLMVSNLLAPGASDLVPAILLSPVVYAALLCVVLLATVVSLHKVGQSMGGTGRFYDVMALIVWLQYLRVMVNVAVIVLLYVLPALSMLLGMAASIVGLYILLHFINQAHALGSLMRAAGVLAIAVICIAVALFLLLALVGGPSTGAYAYV